MKRLTKYKFRDNLPHRVIALATQYVRASKAQYNRDHGIGRAEGLIINTVGRRGPQTAAAIVREGQVDKAQVSRGIGKLVENGLVAYYSEEQDLRHKTIKLTPAGQAAFSVNVSASQDRYRAWMKDISEEELQVFEHILKKLQRNADELVLAGPAAVGDEDTAGPSESTTSPGDSATESTSRRRSPRLS